MSTTQRTMAELAVLTVIGALALAAMLHTTSRSAHADANCAATCNATHDQCLASTNDRYTCDSQRNQCLKTCGGG